MSTTTPKTVHGIDLTAPNGIEMLMDFHRQTFGDATMSADGDHDDAAGAAPKLDADGNEVIVVDLKAKDDADAAAGPKPKIAELHPSVQKIIRDYRDGEADKRTRLVAAEQTHKDSLASLAKALGLAEDAAQDAAALVAHSSALLAENRSLRLDSALATALTTAKASPLTTAVLRGEGKLDTLNPASEGFTAALDILVADALTAHPELKLNAAAGSSGPDFSGSQSGVKTTSKSLADAISKRLGQ